jgi:hypothetical protein
MCEKRLPPPINIKGNASVLRLIEEVLNGLFFHQKGITRKE